MENNSFFEKTPPTKLIFIVAIPGILSMLVSMLFQVIDGAYVGQLLGADGFAAINLVMPLVIINFSVADLIGVGSSVIIAIKLGEKKFTEANKIFSGACLLIVTSAIVLGAVLFIYAEKFLLLIGARGAIVTMATQYLRVYCLFSPVNTILFAVDNYLRICGKIHYSLFVNVFLSVMSMGLEAILLFVFKVGIWGAALGTCISATLCTVIAFLPFLRNKTQLRFSTPKLPLKVVGSILVNGCPTFFNNISGRVISIIMNIFLLKLGGAVAVATYGVLMYIDFMFQVVLYGLCDSLQPAIGYNWGANNRGRVKGIAVRIFGISAIISVILLALTLLLKSQLIGIFAQADDSALISMSLHALPLFALAYITRWVSLAVQSFFSAIGKALYATTISLACAFVFPLALLFALSSLRLDGLWLNFPITALLSAILSLILLLIFRKKKKTSGAN